MSGRPLQVKIFLACGGLLYFIGKLFSVYGIMKRKKRKVSGMRFEQLNCLVEIAETGSITAAAQKLFISQQAVSTSVKQLEQELGQTLFVRNKSGISFTAKGEETVNFARKILADKEEFVSRMRMEEDEETIEMKVCSTSSVTNIVLPDIIEKLDAKQIPISLRISLKDDIAEVFESLRTEDANLGLLTFNAEYLPQKFAAYQEELQLEILARDELVAVVNKRFCKDVVAQIPREALSDYRYSIYNVIPIDSMLESAKNTSVVWSNDVDFHRRMLEQKRTLVLMPGLAYQYFFSGKKYVALPLEENETPLIHAAVFRKDASPAVRDFASMVHLELCIK